MLAKLHHILPLLLFLIGSVFLISGTILMILREWPK